MQQNINPYYFQYPCQQIPPQGPNAVSINIIQPQAYGNTNGLCSAQGFYPLYQTNPNPNLPLYPMNYNNMIQQPIQYMQAQPLAQQEEQNKQKIGGAANAYGDTNLLSKTSSSDNQITKETVSDKTKDKEKTEKTKVILTDDYIKSLENYLNDSNPKIRLIAVKELLERFKEDDSRIAHPSLTPLLNKALRDTSPSIRFLALTTLQLGYSIGDDETIQILKEIKASNQDKLGEDALLASEILLNLSAPKVTEAK